MSSHDNHAPRHLDPHALGHIQPLKVYILILGLLLGLTVITVVAANIHFNPPVLNIVVAMLIASVKAMLVALFFMHLRYENPLTWLYAAFPLILLVFLIGGVFLDNGTRDSHPVPYANPYLAPGAIVAPSAEGAAEQH